MSDTTGNINITATGAKLQANNISLDAAKDNSHHQHRPPGPEHAQDRQPDQQRCQQHADHQ